MDIEKLGQLVSEFEMPDTQESRKTEIMTELSDGVGRVLASQEKMKNELDTTKEKNHQLQLKNAHFANRVASQILDQEDRQQEIKKEEKKNRTLSDALYGK